MWYLLLQIWIWLFVAAFAGLLLGWVLWGRNKMSIQERIQFHLQNMREQAVEVEPGRHRIGRKYSQSSTTDDSDDETPAVILAQDL